MKIEKIPISRINAATYNPRKDLKPGDAEWDKLVRSIEDFGFVEPLVWNKRTSILVGGHQRLKVLKHLGHTEVEVSVVDLDEPREKALNIALNKVTGEWDIPMLKELLVSLDDGSFDVTSTGFSEEEIEALVTSTPERPQDIPLKPYQKVHILLSFPPAIMPKVSAAIDKVRNIQGVEYEQSAN